MLIEQLDPAQIVEPEGSESSLLFQLPDRRAGRLFARLDVPVDTLPGSGTAPRRAPSQSQALELRPTSAKDIHVYQRGANRRHGRHSAKAARSAIPASWDFSGWN